jgi:hypothetical protein
MLNDQRQKHYSSNENGKSNWIAASDDESIKALNKGFDHGLNFVDTALGTYRLLWLLCHLFLFWLFKNS